MVCALRDDSRLPTRNRGSHTISCARRRPARFEGPQRAVHHVACKRGQTSVQSKSTRAGEFLHRRSSCRFPITPTSRSSGFRRAAAVLKRCLSEGSCSRIPLGRDRTRCWRGEDRSPACDLRFCWFSECGTQLTALMPGRTLLVRIDSLFREIPDWTSPMAGASPWNNGRYTFLEHQIYMSLPSGFARASGL